MQIQNILSCSKNKEHKKNKIMKKCKMKAVNNQHQLLLKEEVDAYDEKKNLKSINTKSDEK